MRVIRDEMNVALLHSSSRTISLEILADIREKELQAHHPCAFSIPNSTSSLSRCPILIARIQQ